MPTWRFLDIIFMASSLLLTVLLKVTLCGKCPYLGLFWPLFSTVLNTVQKNSKYGHFSRSVTGFFGWKVGKLQVWCPCSWNILEKNYGKPGLRSLDWYLAFHFFFTFFFWSTTKTLEKRLLIVRNLHIRCI